VLLSVAGLETACLLPTRPWPPDASRDVVDVHRVRVSQGMVDVPETDAIDDSADGSIGSDVPSSGPSIRFHVPTAAGPVAFGAVPFPSDVYRDASGHLSISNLPVGPSAAADAVDIFNASLARLDGFSVTAAAFFGVEGGALDPATASNSVHLYDLASCAEIPVRTNYRADQGYLVVAPAPGQVLLERAQYGYALTNGLHTSDGTPFVASPEYAAVRDAASPPADGPARVAFDGSEAVIRCAGMASTPIARADIVAATSFTTMNVRGTLRSLHDQIFTAPAPQPRVVRAVTGSAMDMFLGTPQPGTDGMTHYGGDNPGGVLHSHIAWLVHGQFGAISWIAAQRFQKGAFDYDTSGAPRVKGLIPLRFTLTLPVTSGGDYSNLPVVIYSHGFTTTRSGIFDVAEAYCSRGYAVIGIDLPFHGERNAASMDVVNNITGAPGMDYIGDPVGANAAVDFFDLNGDSVTMVAPLDPTVMRDTLRQAAADIIQEVRMVRDGDWSMIRAADPALATLSFDRDHIALTGNSFGAFMVGLVQPMTPEAGLAMMTVPAAGLVVPSLIDSATFQPALGPFVLGAYDLYAETDVDSNNFLQSPDDSPRHPRWSPMWNLFHTLLEPGDPLAYAPYMFDPMRSTHPAAVVIVEAYADEVVPNQATEPYAAALGLPYVSISHPMAPPGPRYATFMNATAPVTGNLASGATGGWVQFAPANHGIASTRNQTRDYQIPSPPIVPLPAPMPIANEVDAALNMLAGLLESWRTNATPTLPDPYM
jgi:dienelactone hydrolase